MVMRRLDQVLADVLIGLGIEIGGERTTLNESAHPPRLAEGLGPAGCETDGEAASANTPPRAVGKDRLPANITNRVSRAGLTLGAHPSMRFRLPKVRLIKDCGAGNWKSAGAEAPASFSGGSQIFGEKPAAFAKDNRVKLKGPAPCTVHRSRHIPAPNAL